MATSGAPDMRTKLGRAKGLGSAHHGVGHWWLQRVTAVALMPLTIWFINSLVASLLSDNYLKVQQWLASPINATCMVLLLVAGFTHARLGAQVVIEDYVKSPVAKYTLLLLNTFLCYGFAAICIIAILKLHFLDVATST